MTTNTPWPIRSTSATSRMRWRRREGAAVFSCCAPVTHWLKSSRHGCRPPSSMRRGVRLGAYLDAFRAAPDGVLLTPAAWAGVSLPGMVDHVVIPRIPVRPPSVEDEARRSFLSRLGLAPANVEGLIAGDRGAAARRKLAQGIGRGIRGPAEICTLWLLDPRFPLPKSMARAIGGRGQGRAVNNLPFINCIPSRFRIGRNPDIDQGRIWPFEPRPD